MDIRSLPALRAEHVELLRRYNTSGLSPEFRSDAALFIRSGQAAGAYVDDEEQRIEAQQILDHWSTVLFRGGDEPPDATLAEFDPAALPELAEDRRPYVGLNPFDESAAAQFFGRDEVVTAIVDGLAIGRLVLLVGPSGSGRSSVVAGGLLGALKGDAIPGSASWRYVSTRLIGADPLMNLARVATSLGAAGSADLVRARLRENPASFAAMLGGAGSSPALLIVDGFELVFTLPETDPARKAFLASLSAVSADLAMPHRIVLVLRSDFETQFNGLRREFAFASVVRVAIPPPSRDDLRAIIEKPAAAAGLRFQDGLVDVILKDLEGESLPLPLLQFTLMKLWQHRDRDRVTLQAYERLGGVRLALSAAAEALSAELDDELEEVLKLILLRLVQVEDSGQITTTRSSVGSLYLSSRPHAAVDTVLGKLLEAGLVRRIPGESRDEDEIELAHEILVRSWPRLAAWIEQERQGLTGRRRFQQLVREWQRLGRGTAGLLDAVQLGDAQHWLAADGARLGYDEALPALVQASRAAAARQRRRRRRLQGVAAAIAVGSLATAAYLWRVDSVREAVKDQLVRGYQAAEPSRGYRAPSELPPEAALEQFEKARALDPRNVDVLRALAQAYAAARRDDDAARIYEEMFALDNTADDRIALGDLYLAHDDLARARPQFEAAAALAPDSLDAQFRMGIVRFHEGALADAEKVFTSLHEKSPAWPYPHIWLGYVYLARGQVDQAVAEYTKAVRLAPSDADAHLGLADAFYAKADYLAATGEYNRAIALAPDDIRCRRGLANAYYAQDQFDAARAEYARALDALPADADRQLRSDLLNGLGYTYLKLGDADQALQQFNKALAVSDKAYMAWLNIGIIRAQQERDGDARKAWERGVSLMAATDPYQRLVRAFYLALIGRPGADDEFRKVLADAAVTAPALRDVLSDADLLSRTSVNRERSTALAAQMRAAIARRTSPSSS